MKDSKLYIFVYTLSLFIGIILFHFFTVNKVNAEGTKEIMPYDSCESRIVIYPSYNQFASVGAGPNHRLHIHIENIGEKIYFGFGDIFDGYQNQVYDLSYSLMDPAGNIAITQTLIPTIGTFGYITSYQKACIGPSIINSLGYISLSYIPTMVGDYYIEFSFSNNQSSGDYREIDIFDITVTNNVNTPIKGRIWSKEWLFIVPLSSGANVFENPFYGNLFMYSNDSIVTKVDFNGIRPRLFSITTNSSGTGNTGNFLLDRKSKLGDHTYPEYKIFVNNPDSISYPSGQLATFTAPINFTGCPGNYNINIHTNALTSVQLLIELNGISGYQAGTEDVLINQNTPAGSSAISWNGINGLGQAVLPGTVINLYCALTSGLTHMPIYDVEHNPQGFKINIVRPISNSTQFNLYWDDSNFPNSVPAPSAGCASTSGCHNFPLMFGDNRTINTWWYASSNIIDSLQFTLNGMVWDTLIISNPSCIYTNDGNLIANILGGTAPYIYQLNGSNVSNFNLINLTAGNQILTVTDSNNCTLIDTVNLIAPIPVQVTLLSSPYYCGIGTGSVITTNQSGNTPFHYLWSTGANDTLNSIHQLIGGLYSVTITDNNNCSFIFSVSVLDLGSFLQTQEIISHDTCGNGQGEIQVLLSNGTPPITYSWNTNPLLNVNTISNLSAGNYSVTITDSTGCNTVNNYQILDMPAPVPDFIMPTDVCVNTPFNIQYNGNQVPPDSFQWNFSGAQILSGSNDGPYSLQLNNIGTHTVSLNVSKLGCPADSISRTLSAHKAIINLDILDHVNCFNGLDGYIEITLLDVMSPFTLLWNNISNNSLIYNQLSSGNYQIIVLDSISCTDTLNVFVQQPSKLLANTTNIDASCSYSLDGLINAFANGGTWPYQYQFENHALGLDSIFDQLSSGTYQILVNDAHGCKDSIQTVIGFSQDILADFNVYSSPNIESAGFVDFTFTGYGAISYLWNFGDNNYENSQNPSHLYADFGNKQVELMVNSGPPHNCWDTMVKTIKVETPFQIFIPNAFSPNNDGLNDFFLPIGVRISTYQMNIYSKWGELIYTTNSIENGWDGTYKNKKMSMGVYTYIIIIETEGGKAFKKTGTFTLLL